uniref:Uncharacterized protein n=1 Tax=Sphaerulina musiva TaxID=85929 RepID=A0A109VZU6_9PEZI|nr:hypothetical protein [Sphaerulina musiva]AJF39501.1 hypothetical protein [Sphaerulina musiva]AJF39522.1 hypothetical protein [Sphaerulina musiva]AJF39525.1 hypothetical protein [Sphaerulina musiva]AJF39526.1 hypothetical protein [Sphaerulina musiva]
MHDFSMNEHNKPTRDVPKALVLCRIGVIVGPTFASTSAIVAAHFVRALHFGIVKHNSFISTIDSRILQWLVRQYINIQDVFGEPQTSSQRTSPSTTLQTSRKHPSTLDV